MPRVPPVVLVEVRTEIGMRAHGPTSCVAACIKIGNAVERVIEPAGAAGSMPMLAGTGPGANGFVGGTVGHRRPNRFPNIEFQWWIAFKRLSACDSQMVDRGAHHRRSPWFCSGSDPASINSDQLRRRHSSTEFHRMSTTDSAGTALRHDPDWAARKSTGQHASVRRRWKTEEHHRSTKLPPSGRSRHLVGTNQGRDRRFCWSGP
jgi:hypothetical protein